MSQLKKLWQRMPQELREISHDISRAARAVGKPPQQQKKGPEIQTAPRQTPVPHNPPKNVDRRRRLTDQMEREVYSAYYKDGGFRFFACDLQRYVEVELPLATDVKRVQVEAYNSCVFHMLRIVEKLEQTLKLLQKTEDINPYPLENKDLLESMCDFRDRGETLNPDIEKWTIESYRTCLQLYAERLTKQLLDVWMPPCGEVQNKENEG